MRTSQKNEVIQYDFNSHQVRAILLENQIYFIAKDVCDVLGIAKPDNATRYLHESQKMVRLLDVGTKHVNMLLLNESGLYALLFKSRKEEAQRFQLWVTNEVLPSIRKTGTYSVVNPQMTLDLQPVEVVRVIPNELYETILKIDSKATRLKLMKFYKQLAEKGGAL